MFERITLITWKKPIDPLVLQQLQADIKKQKQQFAMTRLSFLTPADQKSAQSWDLGFVCAFESMDELKDFFQSFEYQKMSAKFEDKIDCIKGWNFEVIED